MKSHASKAKIQRWGNSLAVRIPADLARRAHFEAGSPVEVVFQDNGIAVCPVGERILTLSERLAQFNPEEHGGEAMPFSPVGRELL